MNNQQYELRPFLYHEFQSERSAVLEHKWIESEKIGKDCGFEWALLDWIHRYRGEWRLSRTPETFLSGLKNKNVAVCAFSDLNAFKRNDPLSEINCATIGLTTITGIYTLQPECRLRRIDHPSLPLIEGGILVSDYRRDDIIHKVYFPGNLAFFFVPVNGKEYIRYFDGKTEENI